MKQELVNYYVSLPKLFYEATPLNSLVSVHAESYLLRDI
jgi:hypothetical protein